MDEYYEGQRLSEGLVTLVTDLYCPSGFSLLSNQIYIGSHKKWKRQDETENNQKQRAKPSPPLTTTSKVCVPCSLPRSSPPQFVTFPSCLEKNQTFRSCVHLSYLCSVFFLSYILRQWHVGS
jgi:hypothetical protein